MQKHTGNLFVRADATSAMGTGHVMRCIALAQAWQDHGGKVIFLTHCESDNLQQRIQNEGFQLIPIAKPHPDLSDLTQTLEYLERSALCSLPSAPSPMRHASSPWLVLDGYHFTLDYQKAIRENSYRLLVIDDMAHLDHYHADILLNQNIHAPSLHYSCDRDTVKLLGCEYVLLRREFLKYKDWKREIPEKAKKILVTMGGADPDNVTLKVIKALNSLDDSDLEVKIIAGPANPNISSLEKELRLSPFNFCLLPSVSNMPELMAWADVAISAGGSTCWELAFMGLPILIITVADNQMGIAEGLGKAGAGIDLGWHDKLSLEKIVLYLSDIIHKLSIGQKYSVSGQRSVDGRGGQRVIGVIVGDMK
jgi:UDP-2,4-diacetamido-2,4,6-trideoxy-beta-L-altropyranose hydrolase